MAFKLSVSSWSTSRLARRSRLPGSGIASAASNFALSSTRSTAHV
jgi:hypothetical protein